MIRQLIAFPSIAALLASVAMLASPNVIANTPIWQAISPQSVSLQGKHQAANKLIAKQRLYQLDPDSLQNRMALVPHESSGDYSQQLELPMPDGRITRFEIIESPIERPSSSGVPSLSKSYKVKGIDDPQMSGRVSLSRFGFDGFLISGKEVILIRQVGSKQDQYASSLRAAHHDGNFSCGTHAVDQGYHASLDFGARTANRVSGRLLEFEIAVAATSGYVAAVSDAGDTDAQQIEATKVEIFNAISAVNVYYERDHGIRITLVENDGRLIESGTNVANEIGNPFSNLDGFAMLDENQEWIDAIIGDESYDIGHAFSSGEGGVAALGSVCTTGSKAFGVTGLPTPNTPEFYIDFVAHEIGHQFGATHTFNGTSGACFGGNRTGGTAFEPGSGSSIMAYAGICGAEDIQSTSSATFHAGSISQIETYTNGGGSCGASVVISNTDPTIVTISGSATIPYGTPFQLSTIASDTETGDTALLYQWDQMDAGLETDAVSLGLDLVTNALFRTFVPENRLASRDFPALGTQAKGFYDVSEALPCQNRELNFRATVRDGDSGQDTADVLVNVTRQAGPFEVTSQVADQTLATDFTVTWDVADTDSAPVSCSTVSIDLLAFDNATYDNYSVHSLLAGTANDGTELVSLPANTLIAPARGRLRVMCDNNVFYALSEGDLTISGVGAAFDVNDNSTFHNDDNGTTVLGTFVCGSGIKFGDSEYSGASEPWWWLVLAGGIAAINRIRRQPPRRA